MSIVINESGEVRMYPSDIPQEVTPARTKGAATMNYQRVLEGVASDIRPFIGQGALAAYIPPLSRVDPNSFGLALRLLDGRLFVVGDANVRFSIQSISKTFALAFAISLLDEDIWSRVGRESSGTPFNSLVQLEVERGKPRNPFINAGALVVVDILASHYFNPETAVLQFIRDLAGSEDIGIDLTVARAEQDTSYRNLAIANFVKSFGNLHNSASDVVKSYCHQCAVSMSCAELATASSFLANAGVSAETGARVIGANQARRINALMTTCGTYDAAGDVAYRVGLPAKSGVGGGVLAVIPGVGAACAWGPGLDDTGNSMAGIAALERLAIRTGWSIY